MNDPVDSYAFRIDGIVFCAIILIEIDFQFRPKHMNNSRAYKLAPAVTDDRKIEVSLEDKETVIRLYDWVEGLGWSTQKTLRLDPEMLDDLHKLVSAARLRIKREAAEKVEPAVTSKVLDFPQFS